MLYWVIMGLLLVVAAALVIIIIVTLKKNNRSQEDYDYEDEYDDDDEYDDEEEEVQQPVKARKRSAKEPDTEEIYREQPPKKIKRQWRVILENVDTWEKFSYTFYDNIGIGRSRSDGSFEKFLTIKEDPRVSKLHCVIIRKEDALYLQDMSSRNGTYLNGKRIFQPEMIQRDDIIAVGETQIEVKKILRERE